MLRNVYLPKNLVESEAFVQRIGVAVGDRVRPDQALLQLSIVNNPSPLLSAYHGWVRFVAVTQGQRVEPGSLLLIIDAQEVGDYRLDELEVSLNTELGENGRRGEERQGQRQYTKGYSGELFDAPREKQGMQESSVKEHPYLQKMKEGVPPKMSNARENAPATERLVEEAAQNPELRLSHQLQAQLNITPSSTSAPNLSRG